MKKLALILLALVLLPLDMEAQCSMCRAVLESGEQQKVAEGINNGIIYLMALPYLMVGALGYVVYRKMKK